jgi:hypothetical protein
MINYIPDTNAFSLAGPPQWWLAKLWDFDSSLVVIPSRQTCLYRLAQRRKLNLPEHITNNALFNESDTRMLASYGLIPVTSILPTANWSNPYLFQELANRAPHRNGGAQKAADMMDEQDLKDEFDKRQQTDENLQYLAKDAWKYYNKKIGLRGTIDLGAK